VKSESIKKANKDKNFFTNILNWTKAHKIWFAVIVIGVLVLGIVLTRSLANRNSNGSDYQTTVIEEGDLIAIVGATGVVESNQSVELDWETTGRVETVNVSINDQVEKGDILAELADNTLPQSVILAKADLVSAKKSLDDLVNSTTESAVAYTNLLEAESDLRVAEEDRDEWNYNEVDMDRIYTARDEFLDAEELLKDAQYAFDLVSDLDDEDPERVEAEETLDDAQFERDKALRNLNYIQGKSYDRQVAEDFADYDVALAQLQDAQREWERVKDGPNLDDITAAEARVAAAEATVSQSWIEAPFSGTITKAFPKAGDEVMTAENAFRIDDLSELFVKVDISEVDINRVELGQRAELTFDAILGEQFEAEVVEVSRVGIDSGNGVEFLVTLKILNENNRVRPGMTAAVNLVVNEIKGVLYVPNRAVRLMENERVIFKLVDGELVQTPIEFGASSDINSEILSGDVEEGDIVVLNPPLELVSGQPPAFVR